MRQIQRLLRCAEQGLLNRACLLLTASMSLLLAACEDSSSRNVELSARPGETIIVPFERPARDSRTKALSFVPASPRLDPKELPEGAELVHSSIALFGSGKVSGDLLIRIPPEAQGDIAFKVSASGDGSQAIGGAAASFSTDDVDVSINVSGEEIDETRPGIEGEWRDGERIWVFQHAIAPTLKITHPTGEKDLFRLRYYAGKDGRWFLVATGEYETVYWIELDEAEQLLVSTVRDEFEPFHVFSRQGAHNR